MSRTSKLILLVVAVIFAIGSVVFSPVQDSQAATAKKLPAPSILTPKPGTTHCNSKQVYFSWKAVPGATSYKVSITDQAGTRTTTVKGTSLYANVFGKGPVKLNARWSVTAIKGQEKSTAASSFYINACR